MFNRKFDLTDGVVNYRQPSFCRYTTLMFAVVFILSELFMYIPTLLYTFFATFKPIVRAMGKYASDTSGYFNAIMEIMNDVTESVSFNIFSLFNTACIICAVLLYCKFAEKRTIRSLGIKFDKSFITYLVGLIIGFLMITASVFVSKAGGALSFDGYASPRFYIVILFFFGYVIQGAAEEILMRGFFMVSFGARHGLTPAVIISSLVFALLHVGNSGFGFLPFINIFLFGVFEAFVLISTNNIWCASAIHSMWNFAQGHIYGLSVSGNLRFDSIVSFSLVEKHNIINGGVFGPEGGLAVTATLLVSIAVLLLVTKKKDVFSGKSV